MKLCKPENLTDFQSHRRAITSRQYLIAAAVVAGLTVAGVGGYLYYRSNSPYALYAQANIALEQHDTTRAIDFLQRAISKNPTGEIAINLRTQMARALIDAGREIEARPFLQEALTLKPDDGASLDLLAETHVHIAVRKLNQSLKPLTDASIAEILSTVDTELGTLEKLPQEPRQLTAEARLHRLAYIITDDQFKKASARLAAAKLANDPVAADKAEQQIAALKSPTAHRDRATELLQSALKIDPKNTQAAEFLVQFELQDHQFVQALALYNQLKAAGVTSPELAINGARILIADTARQPVSKTRYADAQKELESYLADHAKDPAPVHVLVAIGDTLLEQNKISDADAMAVRAAAASPGDLDAQILLVNIKLRENKSAEALALVSPLTTSNGNVPQIWYLLGQANTAVGDLRGAEDHYKKALALDPTYTAARRELLKTYIRSGDNDAAVLLASEELKEDRYYIPAWNLTAEDLQKHGQADRAESLVVELASDPELPVDSRPEVIELLLQYNILDAAKKLFATLPPGDEAAVRLAPLIAQADNRIADARALLAKQLAASPDDTDLRLRYTELLLRSKLDPDARQQLDLIVASAPKNAISAAEWLGVARGYLDLRLPENALAAVKEALAAQPKSFDAQILQERATAMLTGAPTAAFTDPDITPDNSTVADTIRLAAAALAKKDYENTLTLARGGLSKDPANILLHHLAARALAGLGQIDKAVAEIAAAANAQPNSANSFAVFIELFPSPEAARSGLAYVNSLTAINPALGNWAIGRLAEISGNPGGAMTYYQAGLANTSRTLDPGAAKEVLYRAVLNLDAQQKNIPALQKDADAFAGEPAYTTGIRLLASEQLRLLGDNAAAADQLDKLTAVLAASPQPQVLTLIAQHWIGINHPERAVALLEKYLRSGGAGPRDPVLLELYAALLEKTDAEKSLKIRQEIAATDPSNPQYRIGVARSQAAVGDEGAAFRTLDEVRNLGETGKELATAARLQLLITLGLLKEAADELPADKSAATDYASMLAIGKSWAQLSKPEEARKILSGIPAYAAEYPEAVAALADLDFTAGNIDGAIAALSAKNLTPYLFHTYLRAGRNAEALDLARKQIALYPVNTAAWRTWTLFAAVAARESQKYSDAVAFINTLDPDSKKALAFDVALLDLLQNKPEAAAALASDISDEAPTYYRSTLLLLANSSAKLSTRPAILLNDGSASTVYAFLAAHFPKKIESIPEIAGNPRLIPDDVNALLVELAAFPGNMVERLHELALAQLLVELNWDTAALAILDQIDKSPPDTTLALLQRQRAEVQLHRTAAAAAIVEKIAAKIRTGTSVPPSDRILLAADASQKEDYPGAIADLEPLVPLNRTDVLNALATFYEKAGQIDKAIELNREVRKLDPNNIHAANNLAYTLATAHPGDQAALAEAKSAIEFAISKAPGEPTFQDTLAWIEILSGDPAGGAKRLAKVLPALRLFAPVHYHLGIAYAKSGQADLARMHLQNVQALSQSKTPIPEINLAAEALKTLASGQK